MYQLTASAPGKVIVSGEHAVVYGYPALLAATDLRLEWRVTAPINDLRGWQKEVLSHQSLQGIFDFLQGKSNIKVALESDIPRGSGLGSSAAFSVALASLLLPEDSSLEEINELAYQLETIQHGKPSGGDNTVSCYGGVLWYRKEHEQCKLFQSLKPGQDFPPLWLVDSGAPAESTKEMVELVREARATRRQEIDSAFQEMERVARAWLNYLLSKESLDVADLIHTNHQALHRIGAVSSSTQELISQIESIGGAAKITGAGGATQGSGMVLVYHQDTETLRAWANKKQLSLTPVHLGGPGLQQKREQL